VRTCLVKSWGNFLTAHHSLFSALRSAKQRKNWDDVSKRSLSFQEGERQTKEMLDQNGERGREVDMKRKVVPLGNEGGTPIRHLQRSQSARSNSRMKVEI